MWNNRVLDLCTYKSDALSRSLLVSHHAPRVGHWPNHEIEIAFARALCHGSRQPCPPRKKRLQQWARRQYHLPLRLFSEQSGRNRVTSALLAYHDAWRGSRRHLTRKISCMVMYSQPTFRGYDPRALRSFLHRTSSNTICIRDLFALILVRSIAHTLRIPNLHVLSEPEHQCLM